MKKSIFSSQGRGRSMGVCFVPQEPAVCISKEVWAPGLIVPFSANCTGWSSRTPGRDAETGFCLGLGALISLVRVAPGKWFWMLSEVPSSLSTPRPVLPCSPSLPPWDGSSQADKEPDPQPPPGLPAELGHQQANCWVNALMGTGAVHLCSVVCSQPCVWGEGPRTDSKSPQSVAPDEYGCFPGHWMNLVLAPIHESILTHAHTLTYIHSHTHTTHLDPNTPTCTDILGEHGLDPSIHKPVNLISDSAFVLRVIAW